VVFHVSHLGIGTVWGRILGEEGKMGSVTLDADAAKNQIALTLSAAQIDTHNQKRDDHLRSGDFFDAKQFPEISFTSTGWKAVDEKTAEVAGTLTLHGVSKPLTAKVVKVGAGKDPWGGERVGFDTSFTVKRSDFGMTTMLDNGGVGDEITVFVSIEAVKKK
jgi:polyisoprenoid-binding protein YceI